ncbi:MAG: DUF5615 family PIN-like protein [Bacteroidota bacterium]
MSIESDYLFLIDENLPPDLSFQLRKSGLKAFHINEARSGNQRVTDDMIRRFTLHNRTVVVSGDDDFVKSYFDRHVPEKLVYVFDLQAKKLLLQVFEAHIQGIIHLLDSNDLIQINKDGPSVPGR